MSDDTSTTSSPPKVALLTGITGQDGAYLADFLLKKGYIVHGIKRRTSTFNTAHIDPLYQDPHEDDVRLLLYHGDLTDSMALMRVIEETQPDEIYNLGAMSHVRVSFDAPEYTANTVGLGTLRLLEVIRALKMTQRTKFYQASTSELYGLIQAPTQDESTPFYPRSPYAAAKLYAHWITINYREAYGIYACNGILFNHESPLRGETFVTRKITRAVAKIALGQQSHTYLGNLEARRDWGFAGDYVEAMWLMLQQDQPRDYVIATGETHSVREFAQLAFTEVGLTLDFRGQGLEEVGYIAAIDEDRYRERTGHHEGEPDVSLDQVVIQIDPYYYRPTEVDLLQGDASKARDELGWQPNTSFPDLVSMMVNADLERFRREELLQRSGFVIPRRFGE